MKEYKRIALLALAAAFLIPQALCAKPMKARTIQPLFAKDAKGLAESFQWTLDELAKCDSSLDIIVLPEFSEVPGATPNNEFLDYVRKYGPTLQQACSETAKRCSTLVFCGAIDMTEYGPRNTIFVFDRQGNKIGGYLKEHLTKGEWANLGFDRSYTQQWNPPYTLEIEGLKFAFLTCYDFYFYENYSNIARLDPDIIIGSSHQRSDRHQALDLIDAFCAYNTGAYLIRASVSMGESSELGGCSCVVSPTGEILGDMYSHVGTMDVTFNPEVKYLKPAGYGNPPSKHWQYVEIGRRPWKYRPGGSAIVLPITEAPQKRICALKGFSESLYSENPIASYGAAVAAGASEIGFTVIDHKSLDDLSSVLMKFSCHTLINIQVNTSDINILKNLCKMIVDYDASNYIYFTSADPAALLNLKDITPNIPRSLIVSSASFGLAKDCGCTMVQIDSKDFSKSFADAAHKSGLRCNVACTGKSSRTAKVLEDGADTILCNDYHIVAKSSGIK